jgi:hypothetical protein
VKKTENPSRIYVGVCVMHEKRVVFFMETEWPNKVEKDTSDMSA